MTHATRTKRFWRRPLGWVLMAIMMLVGWAVLEARLKNERTQAAIRYVESVRGDVVMGVPPWLEAANSRLAFLPSLEMWLIDAEKEFLQSPTIVNLQGTSIDDEGLAHLSELTNLRVLSMGYTEVSDAGLVHLRGLTSLERLYLNYVGVTDAGLEHLAGLTSLRLLDLQGAQVSEAGVNDLRQALPNTTIFWYQPTPPQ